jgi:hypothetical protein
MVVKKRKFKSSNKISSENQIKNKKVVKTKEKKNRSSMIFGIILLVIMCASVISFSFTSGNQAQNANNQDLPFGEYETSNGQKVYWARIGGYDFPFLNFNYTIYENRTDLSNLASKVKTNSEINLVIDESFNSSDSIFLIKRTIEALKINVNLISNSSFINSSNNVLFLTTKNINNSNNMVYYDNDYNTTEILVYHLIK